MLKILYKEIIINNQQKKKNKISQNFKKYIVMVPKHKMIGQEQEFIIKHWVRNILLWKN